MAKPILFDTISRSKFDTLSDDIKAKRNYQIKEDDGKISRHIAGLESGSGGSKAFEIKYNTLEDSYGYVAENSDEVNKAYANNKNLNLFINTSFNGLDAVIGVNLPVCMSASNTIVGYTTASKKDDLVMVLATSGDPETWQGHYKVNMSAFN